MSTYNDSVAGDDGQSVNLRLAIYGDSKVAFYHSVTSTRLQL